ncbi:hypothetical protein AVEN_145661-1 [Araneus ventricosus]|uniref:Uncharacterized protein n=1 Tax=Araneus ventricosus TaxID=182803 RepID=A0A4Y2KWC8_ARAVE|nr:hypothetical protein AVEN_145661-1 [Araneus ventricosus]
MEFDLEPPNLRSRIQNSTKSSPISFNHGQMKWALIDQHPLSKFPDTINVRMFVLNGFNDHQIIVEIAGESKTRKPLAPKLRLFHQATPIHQNKSKGRSSKIGKSVFRIKMQL